MPQSEIQRSDDASPVVVDAYRDAENRVNACTKDVSRARASLDAIRAVNEDETRWNATQPSRRIVPDAIPLFPAIFRWLL